MLLADEEEEEEEEEIGNSLDRSGIRGEKSTNHHNHHHRYAHMDGVVQREGHHPIKTISLHTLYDLAINHVANRSSPSSSESPLHSNPSGVPLLEPEVKIGLGQLKIRYQRVLHGVQAFRSFEMEDEEVIAMQARLIHYL